MLFARLHLWRWCLRGCHTSSIRLFSAFRSGGAIFFGDLPFEHLELLLCRCYLTATREDVAGGLNGAKTNILNKKQEIFLKVWVRSGGRTAFIPMTPETRLFRIFFFFTILILQRMFVRFEPERITAVRPCAETSCGNAPSATNMIAVCCIDITSLCRNPEISGPGCPRC